MSTFTIEELEQIQALTTNNKGLHEKVTDSEWYSADADDAEDDKEPLVATGLASADSSLNGSFF